MQRLHLSNFAAEIIEKEGRKEERKVEYSMYVSDLINASCYVTRFSFTSGKKIVTKPRLRADSSRLYLPIMFRFCLKIFTVFGPQLRPVFIVRGKSCMFNQLIRPWRFCRKTRFEASRALFWSLSC